jgi:putative membrane protein
MRFSRTVYVWEEEPEPSARLVSAAIRWAINAVALWLAAAWVRGIEIEGLPSLLATAAIFGLVNALIKPLAQLIGFPVTCLTLGLFALVINAAMLGLTAWIAGGLGLEVRIDGFLAALLGALLVGFVSAVLSAFVGRPLRRVAL